MQLSWRRVPPRDASEQAQTLPPVDLAGVRSVDRGGVFNNGIRKSSTQMIFFLAGAARLSGTAAEVIGDFGLTAVRKPPPHNGKREEADEIQTGRGDEPITLIGFN